MCGRFALWAGREAIEAGFGVRLPAEPETGYNIAPSRQVTAVRASREGSREAAFLRWGLVPSWAGDPDSGYRMINARADTVFQKPAYRAAICKRRCLIPANAFFEWKRTEEGKQPYLIRLRGEEVFGLAGLWERWQSRETGEAIESCAIPTTRPNRAMRALKASLQNRRAKPFALLLTQQGKICSSWRPSLPSEMPAQPALGSRISLGRLGGYCLLLIRPFPLRIPFGAIPSLWRSLRRRP